MKVAYEKLKGNKNIVIWGTGHIMEMYYPMLDPELNIIAFCDSFSIKWAEHFRDGMPCISKDKLMQENSVLVAIENMEDIRTVSEEMDRKGICYCHIYEAAKAYLPELDRIAVKNYKRNNEVCFSEKMMKFIDCVVPYNTCNLKCGYCYVRQYGDFKNNNLLLHTPEFIRKALSQERLGGRAFINFCGTGETLLCDELLPIVKELLEEGHYIQIVTNGTITRAFDEMLKCGMDLSRVFLKFSFHYQELKKLGILERMADNVNRMWKTGCSITLELVPDDGLVPFIPEIKDFSIKNFGALPHCTVPRDDTAQSLKVLTEMPLEKFWKIWEQFESPMFDFKMENVNRKRFEDCKAGLYAFHMNLETGDAWKCVRNPYIDNLYEDLNRPIPFEAVGNKCCLPYCYNCHAYLALGLVPEVEAPTYYEVRDRQTLDGRHWISDTMKKVFSQKLFLNNGEDEEYGEE